MNVLVTVIFQYAKMENVKKNSPKNWGADKTHNLN